MATRAKLNYESFQYFIVLAIIVDINKGTILKQLELQPFFKQKFENSVHTREYPKPEDDS